MSVAVATQWQAVCKLDDLIEDSGVCVLINENTKDEKQVALFWLGDDKLYAVDNYCPFGKANVLYRGILGSLGGRYVVASPLYKQHFDLVNGKCLEDDSVSITTYPVRLSGQSVEMSW